MLAGSEREAAAGAKIIFWSETAVYVLVADEHALLDYCRNLAKKYHIYLGMAIGTWIPDAQHPLQNKLVLIDPTGRIAWQYLKARPRLAPKRLPQPDRMECFVRLTHPTADCSPKSATTPIFPR
jgi:hypothetical protein